MILLFGVSELVCFDS